MGKKGRENMKKVNFARKMDLALLILGACVFVFELLDLFLFHFGYDLRQLSIVTILMAGWIVRCFSGKPAAFYWSYGALFVCHTAAFLMISRGLVPRHTEPVSDAEIVLSVLAIFAMLCMFVAYHPKRKKAVEQ